MTKERALERRRELFAINRDGLAGDVTVITPGVIEAWFDRATRLYIQRMPSPAVVKRLGNDRFTFKVLTYEECHAALSRAIDLIDPARRKWFLFTVSPVPLRRTFTNQDVIIANQYSKSLLRAVVGRICCERENCDYFPSYETVMLTKRDSVWDDDLVHVSDSFVSRIVQHLVSGRLEGGAASRRLGTTELLIRFENARSAGDSEAALAAYRQIGEDALEVKIPPFHQRAAKLFADLHDYRLALAHAERLAALRPGRWQPLHLLALMQYRAGEEGRARETAAKALALAKQRKQRTITRELIDRFSASAGAA